MADKKGYNRRDFLKVVGLTSGLAATGCAKDVPEKLIPYVIQPDEVVPGVATWYAATCNECNAGCGTLIRTREGRAVKVEGNPHHPVNRGGLCALGQSSLQSLYNPDRVREPLKRQANGSFKPISWKEAIADFSKAVKERAENRELVIVSKPKSASASALIEDFKANVSNTKHIEYQLLSRDTIDAACEKSFGVGTTLHFDFSKADAIISFGADYLETWLSPMEFSRSWAEKRKPDAHGKVSWVCHVEPRLSLTAANADFWVKNAAGTESQLLSLLLKKVLEKGLAKGLTQSEKRQAEALVASVDEATVLGNASVTSRQIEMMVKGLEGAESPLIIAGGASASGDDAVTSVMLANILNAALGSIGKTVIVRKSEKKSSQSGYNAVAGLIEGLSAEKRSVGVLVFSDVNPAYTLSQESGFKAAVSKADYVVAVSTHFDETAALANLVLPLSTSFESWSDSEPAPGVFSLNQPSMQPLYQSQSLEDTLIVLAHALETPIGEFASFHQYIQSQWSKRTGALNFNARWLTYVERGGDWAMEPQTSTVASLDGQAFSVALAQKKHAKAVTLVAYPTIRSFDGSSANRPWLQELPDPMTTSVWGSWIELHPELAASLGVEHGETIKVQTEVGAIEAPAYLTKHIHPKTVAMPLGQGHIQYGRYATGIGANALSILPFKKGGTHATFVTSAEVKKTLGQDELVTTQGHDYAKGRGVVRSISAKKLAKDLKHHDNHHGGHGDHHAGGHHDLFALGPQPKPKQMYNQMEHPLYKWGMTIDLNSCTGCAACVVACYAENNVPVVGKEFCAQGREMSWIRIDRYLDGPDDRPVTAFMPLMCQHCGNAPCEPVCPVYATYHNEEGLNAMVYNRCVGTRYCSNNCSYKVRRFNWFDYEWPEPLTWQLNPDVTVRSVGVMEKCTFCVQRIREAQNNAKNDGREVADGEIQPACASSCPTKAIVFGNLNDHEAEVYKKSQDARSYKVLDSHLNTQPAVNYLAKIDNDLVEG